MQTPDHLPYSFRPATLDDLRAIYELSVASDVHDRRFWTGALADVERELTDPNLADTLLAHTPAGQLAGLIFLFTRSNETQNHRVTIWPDCHPDYRQLELEDYLMAWAHARSLELLARYDDDLPQFFRTFSPAHDAHRLSLLQRHGFVPVRYFFDMRRDLSQPIDEVRLPAALHSVTWSPGLNEGAVIAYNDSFQDHWDYHPFTLKEWERIMIKADSFRDDLSFLAMADEQVAAIAINGYSPEENRRKGVDEAWIDILGVRRAWRRQGVATALLNQSMQAFKAAGIAYATLGVDSENPTGALGVYQRVGFEIVDKSVSLRRYIK